MQKPTHLATQNADSFQDPSVAKAYRYRSEYPAELFTLLPTLCKDNNQRVLDVGCGTGDIARNLINHVEHIDAVDFSTQMITQGKTLPNGQHPHLNWIHGRIEDVNLQPPYGLIVAGESFHWFDWQTVLPRFKQLLVPDGYLAIVNRVTYPSPWSILDGLSDQYRTDGGYEEFDIFAHLEHHHLFHKLGEQTTHPIPFKQSITDFISSYHSRAGFSKERMGTEKAREFAVKARAILEKKYSDGIVHFEVSATLIWGIPMPHHTTS